MAALDYSRSRAADFGSVFARVFGAVAAWNDARVTRKALSKLSARELDDIGLCYGDIQDITAHARHF